MSKRGITLIELLIAIVLFSAIAVASALVFRAILLNWNSQETRSAVYVDLTMGMEEMARDLIVAKNIASTNADEVRFASLDGAYHIYYLYHPEDSYPPSFNQDRYELRKAELTGVSEGDLSTGAFAYGNGKIVIENVMPPSITDLSINANIITIDMSAKSQDDTLRFRRDVRPRNIGL